MKKVKALENRAHINHATVADEAKRLRAYGSKLEISQDGNMEFTGNITSKNITEDNNLKIEKLRTDFDTHNHDDKYAALEHEHEGMVIDNYQAWNEDNTEIHYLKIREKTNPSIQVMKWYTSNGDKIERSTLKENSLYLESYLDETKKCKYTAEGLEFEDGSKITKDIITHTHDNYAIKEDVQNQYEGLNYQLSQCIYNLHHGMPQYFEETYAKKEDLAKVEEDITNLTISAGIIALDKTLVSKDTFYDPEDLLRFRSYNLERTIYINRDSRKYDDIERIYFELGDELIASWRPNENQFDSFNSDLVQLDNYTLQYNMTNTHTHSCYRSLRDLSQHAIF